MQQFRNKIFTALVVALLLALPLQLANGQVSIIAVDGTQQTGELIAWDANNLVVSFEGNTETLSIDQLLEIRWSNNNATKDTTAALIELVDGTLLPLGTYEVNDSQAQVRTGLSESKLQIATSKIRRIQFTTLTDQIKELWAELDDKQLAGDILVVHKKNGTVLDYLTGLLGNISSEQVVFNWEGDEIPVKWSKVAGLSYYHANEAEFEQPACWIQTIDGARLPVASVAIDEEILSLTTIGGLELRLPQERVVAADFSQGKLIYLSDLNPIKQTWTPQIALPATAELIQGFGLPRRDQSFTGSALSLAWPVTADAEEEKTSESTEVITYKKGLAIRSRTELRYRIPQGMQHFSALAGIDPETANQGNVVVEIFADDRVIWQGEIAGNSRPAEISAQLDGARQLRILVDYGENLDYGDRLHLVEARVTK